MPNEIESIHTPEMNNGAHFLFVKNVHDRMETETALLANALIKAAAERLTAAYKKEDECYAQSQKSLITDDIRKADEERDQLISGLRRTLKGLASHPDAAKSRSAEMLLKALTGYRLDGNMQLERETGAIISLVGDYETTYAADVHALGLETYISGLKTANEKIERWITERSDSMPQVLGALRTARRESDAAYQWLVKVINAYAVVDKTLDTAPFIIHMNKVIRRNKTQVIGSSKKKKDDDGKTPKQPKDPKDPKQPKDPKEPKPQPDPKPTPDPKPQPDPKPKPKPGDDDGDDVYIPKD